VKVPRLSELRRQAGEAAFEVSILDRVRHRLSQRSLPGSDICLVSHEPTSDTLTLTVVCEAPQRKKDYSLFWLLLLGFFSMCSAIVISIYVLAVRERPEVVGNETVIRLPLPIAKECQPHVQRFNQLQLRNLLSSVPEYEELLRAYPNAVIHV
jgi:hypothetical protein